MTECDSAIPLKLNHILLFTRALDRFEQKQNYIHRFGVNEKDFRVTQKDKSSFWALPKIPTP